MTEQDRHSFIITRLYGQIVGALAQGDRVMEIHTQVPKAPSVENQIYKGVVSRVLPGHQSAFVNIGEAKNGYLQTSDLISVDGLKEGSSISERLNEGDSILVQIKKVAKGGKGPRLTTGVGLPGIYVILLPLEKETGVSRRIGDPKERQRLGGLMKEIRPEGMGLIARKAAEGVPEDALRAEIGRLVSWWGEIQAVAEEAPAPSMVEMGRGTISRALCDLVGTPEIRILIDQEDELEEVRSFCENWSPGSLEKIEARPTGSLASTWKLASTLEGALGARVWLPSGGNLVVEQTEGLVVIDVNTGKTEGKGSRAETLLKTNLEAAAEVARQVRLRNVAGLIVVDFIDMSRSADRGAVEEALRSALRGDRSRCRILPISDMGVVEMTRKRMGQTLEQTWLQSCPTCSGRGSVWADRPMASRTIVAIERESALPGTKVVHVEAHPRVLSALREHEGEALRRREGVGDVTIQLHENPALQLQDVKVYAR